MANSDGFMLEQVVNKITRGRAGKYAVMVRAFSLHTECSEENNHNIMKRPHVLLLYLTLLY